MQKESGGDTRDRRDKRERRDRLRQHSWQRQISESRSTSGPGPDCFQKATERQVEGSRLRVGFKGMDHGYQGQGERSLLGMTFSAFGFLVDSIRSLPAYLGWPMGQYSLTRTIGPLKHLAPVLPAQSLALLHCRYSHAAACAHCPLQGRGATADQPK